MHFALLLFLSSWQPEAAATELNVRAPKKNHCTAYPTVVSSLKQCSTSLSFCESILGRGPSTKTTTSTTTLTEAFSTLDYPLYTTKTVFGTTTVPVLTTTSTTLYVIHNSSSFIALCFGCSHTHGDPVPAHLQLLLALLLENSSRIKR